MDDPVVDRSGDAPAVVVYWRPGCFYCSDLFRKLDRAGIAVERRNIWEDDDARRFVREHNDGNETVPTVALRDQVLTNPPPAFLIGSLLGASVERAGP